MNLAELKEAYKARKLALDSAKKEEEKYKALLKDAMLEAGESDYTDEAGYRFERIVQERKSMNEEKLLAELHERNLTSCITTKEVVDEYATLKAVEAGELPQEVLADKGGGEMIQSDKLKKIIAEVKEESSPVITLSNELIVYFSKELDSAISELDMIMESIGENSIEDIPDSQIEYYCVKIPALMYYAGQRVEELGMQVDLASNARKSNERRR